MPPIWTTPRTWATGELVTGAMLNQHVRDNFDWLKAPPFQSFIGTQAGNYAVAPAINTWTVVSATDFQRTIVTQGGRVWVGFSGFVNYSAAGTGALGFDINSGGGATQQGGTDGFATIFGIATTMMNFMVPLTLAAGSWTIRLTCRITVAGTLTVYNHPTNVGQRSSPVFFCVEGP